MKNTGHSLKRRDFLKTGAAAASTLAVGTYLPRAWAAEPLRVSAYGGYFEDSLVEYVYPEFTKASGIEITSVSQPGGLVWFTNIDTAVKAGGAPPTDVTMTGGQGARCASPTCSSPSTSHACATSRTYRSTWCAAARETLPLPSPPLPGT